MSSHKEHSYCCRALLLLDGIAWGVFLIFKTRLWLIRGVGPAWSDEETDYNYKRLLGPEQSFYGESPVREWGPQGLRRHLLANPL